MWSKVWILSERPPLGIVHTPKRALSHYNLPPPACLELVERPGWANYQPKRIKI